MYHHANYAQQLKRASDALKKTGKQEEAELVRGPLDELIPIDHLFGPLRGDVASFIDSLDEQDKPIDFKELGSYIQSRRELERKKSGILLDPIDEAHLYPEFDDLVRYMSTEQVDRHFDEILDAGVDISALTETVSVDFLKANKANLVELGAKKSAINKRLFRSNVSKLLHKTKQ